MLGKLAVVVVLLASASPALGATVQVHTEESDYVTGGAVASVVDEGARANTGINAIMSIDPLLPPGVPKPWGLFRLDGTETLIQVTLHDAVSSRPCFGWVLTDPAGKHTGGVRPGQGSQIIGPDDGLGQPGFLVVFPGGVLGDPAAGCEPPVDPYPDWVATAGKIIVIDLPR